MTWARSLIIRFLPTATPRCMSPSISAKKAGGVQHDAGGDDALHLGPEDAAGHQRELEGLAVAHDGMPGVGAALVADHDIVLLGQQVDDLAFSLVAPLKSDHASHWHRNSPRWINARNFQTHKSSKAVRTAVKWLPSHRGAWVIIERRGGGCSFLESGGGSPHSISGEIVSVSTSSVPLLCYPSSSRQTWAMRRTASSISASVVVAPKLNRREEVTRSLGKSIARSVGESSVEPLEQAEPTEQATPARSNAIRSISPSWPGKATLLVWGSRIG